MTGVHPLYVLLAALTCSQACVFTDNGVGDLSVTCGGFGVSLNRVNGALTSITTSDGSLISRGSRNGCLYGLVGPNNTYCASCSGTTMTHAWNLSSQSLTLIFSSVRSSCASASVVLEAYEGATFFDLSFHLLSAPSTGAGFFWLLFPSEILFDTLGIHALHMPILPGVALGPGFFAQQLSTSWYYPGNGVFAGWFHIDTANGSLAMYDLSGPDHIAPFSTSPRPASPAPYSPSVWYMAVYHYINVTAGCSPTNTAGPAPPCALGLNGSLVRRFDVRPAHAPASAFETIAQYASDNGMIAGLVRQGVPSKVWPSQPFDDLRTKLRRDGSGDAFILKTFEAPLLKLDAINVALPYANYSAQVIASLPLPSLLHYSSFEVGGFDSNYPDMLPPAARFGTSCDMATSMSEAAAMGHLTMPYFNPTWWDPFSLTLVPFLGDFSSIAALNASGGAYYETYADIPVSKTGIATCPWSPFVQSRIAAELYVLSAKMTYGNLAVPCNSSAPILPSSFIFEDQVSARWPLLDTSPFNAGMSYTGYTAGWQAHLEQFAAAGLHSEQGVDRMARYMIGFHGSVLANVEDGSGDDNWGGGNWKPEPLFGASGLRGIALHFQHNLGPAAMSRDLPQLCWSVAMGIQLSLDVSSSSVRANTSWLAVVGHFQRIILSRFADYSVTYYVASDRSLFETGFYGVQIAAQFSAAYSVFWNTDNRTAARINISVGQSIRSDFDVAPLGCAIVSGNSSARASDDAFGGVFQGRYNGVALAPGLHVIIEDRVCDRTLGSNSEVAIICVYHPWGVDTPLAVALPLSWPAGRVDAIVSALNASFGFIAGVNASTSGAYVMFQWTGRINNVTVAAYSVAAPPSSQSDTQSMTLSPTISGTESSQQSHTPSRTTSMSSSQSSSRTSSQIQRVSQSKSQIASSSSSQFGSLLRETQSSTQSQPLTIPASDGEAVSVSSQLSIGATVGVAIGSVICFAVVIIGVAYRNNVCLQSAASQARSPVRSWTRGSTVAPQNEPSHDAGGSPAMLANPVTRERALSWRRMT